MKVITEHYYNSLVESIIKEKERQAEVLHQTYTGITGQDLMSEISNHLGGNAWAVKRENQVKFTRADINAVANARFNRTTGIQLLLGMVICVFALAFALRFIPNMNQLFYNVYYTFIGIIALIFLYVYSKKASKIRKELWRQLGREEKEEK